MAQDSCLSLIVVEIYCTHPPPWVDWFSAVVSYLPRASVELCSVTAWRTMRTHVSRSWATMTGIQSLIFYPCSQLWQHWCFFLASQTCFIWNIISRNGALNTGQPKGNFSGPCELSSSDPCLVHYKSPLPLLMPRLLLGNAPNYSSPESLEAFKNQNARRQIHYKNKFALLGV